LLPGRPVLFHRTISDDQRRLGKSDPQLLSDPRLSSQYKSFAYLSTFVDPYTRLSLIAGTFTASFQIPNNPGQVAIGNPPVTNAFGITGFNSALLNESQMEDTQYSVLALQRSINGFDGQLSYFTRYDRLHFAPDPLGDLLLNAVASDIVRQSLTNGIQPTAPLVPRSGAMIVFVASGMALWAQGLRCAPTIKPRRNVATFSPGGHRPCLQDQTAKRGSWLRASHQASCSACRERKPSA
jgi:hypothetical protein